jgi:hypothetical protein
MLLFKTILITQFAVVLLLLFLRLDIHPRNILFVAEPLLVALVFWNHIRSLNLSNLPNIALLFFLIAYSIELFIFGYNVFTDNETIEVLPNHWTTKWQKIMK